MIFTFYSYKGGVGRSMALANVAHWLYLCGLKVVIVDWDLEAPGLENFFFTSPSDVERVCAHLGVIDLLEAYKRQSAYLTSKSGFEELMPLDSYLCEIKPNVDYGSNMSDSLGRLRLLTAGWRSGKRFADYAETVQAFDWAEFYTRFRGQEYFEWLRKQLLASADVVLVDSRTGVSEMSGVCTRQLADVVVAFCAPNDQNLYGTLDMINSFLNPEVFEARGRDLKVVILPTRVDDADSESYEKFHQKFTQLTEPYMPQLFKEWKSSFWKLLIPYKAKYSYRESLVTGVAKANEKLEQAYKLLAAHLALFAGEGTPLWLACERELKVLAVDARKEFGAQSWSQAEAAISRLAPEAMEAARRLLLRLVTLSPQSPSLDSRKRAGTADFDSGDSSWAIEQLLTAGIVDRVFDESGQGSLELANESLVKDWPRLREWIQQQRSFLLWRQDLGLQARKWQESGRDPGVLLRGAPLKESLALQDKFDHELNASERDFIVYSHNAEQAVATGERRRRMGSRLLVAALVLVGAGIVLFFMQYSRMQPRELLPSVVAMPASVSAGQRTIIRIRIVDKDGAAVQGASVIITAGGGRFFQPDEAYDSRSALQSPYQKIGATDQNGLYATGWVCNPCSGGYTISVEASKAGFVTTQTNVNIGIVANTIPEKRFRLMARPEPAAVSAGQKAAIVVTVEDESGDPVSGASVVTSAGGGKFLGLRETYDPQATLQSPYKATGITDRNGQFTTGWVCNPCAARYAISVEASKSGFVTAQTDVNVGIVTRTKAERNLRLIAQPEPAAVSAGQKAAIVVTVEDESGDPVSGASVVVSAGGGKFLGLRENYDPQATLQSPYRATGITDRNGQFTTGWVCNPCAARYGMTVEASKSGFVTAQTDVTVAIPAELPQYRKRR